jgi:hypothetical protein
MIRPKRPRTELKISMTRIFTNLSLVSRYYNGQAGTKAHKLGSAASANAALLPLIPTLTPQIKLHIPTVNPDQNSANPV